MPASLEALRLDKVVKAYGATLALGGASLSVATGEIHALLGENGAGKSTTVKILSGLVRPSLGTIEVFGQGARMARPSDAHRLGIQTAFQEISLVRDLTVADNMMLPYAPRTGLGLLRRRDGEAAVRAHLDRIGLAEIDIHAEVRSLDLPQRQKVEIARAIFREPRILLLDEPTSALSGGDIDWLGALIAQLKADGVTTIFISHRMAEVRRFCDRLTVLRNGKEAGTARVDDVGDDEVIRMIIGRSLEATFPPRPRRQARPAGAVPVLSGNGLSTAGRLRGTDFALWSGEILGIAGLQGMGQQDLFHACFGLVPLTAGSLAVDGRPVVLCSPKDAIRPEIGLSLVPEERKTEGLFLKRDGRFNVSLPVLDRFSRFGFLDRRAEERAVAAALDQVDIHPRAIFTEAGAFSGGNQQKIAIAKWLITGGRVLLMFDPTRGIDVGTKHQLYIMMRDFAAAGGSVLFYSTELTELANLCDRVLVMYGGTVVDEVEGDGIDEERIMRGALGSAPRGPGSARMTSLATSPVAAARRPAWRPTLARHRGVLIALAVFAVLFGIVLLVSGFDYFQFSFISAGGGALALATVGQTFVVITGGFDLSAGAVVSLVNVVLGTGMGTGIASQVLFGLAALGIGAAVGALNGFFVAHVRMQPIVVTLSTMFIVQGGTLLIADKPGGAIAPGFMSFFTGDAVAGVLPAPVVVIAAAAAVWLLVRATRFGVGLYAVGSDADAAVASGLDARSVRFRAYVFAGVFYGAAGAFVSAQTGSADPLVGGSMLLQIFAAVALGGTVLGGGRGGAIGSIIGAYTLMIAVNILLAFNVPAFYSSVAEGLLLIFAVVGGSFGRHAPLAGYLRLGLLTLRARRAGTLAAAHRSERAYPVLPPAVRRAHEAATSGWLTRNRSALKYTLPAYAGLLLVLVATQAVSGNALTSLGFFNALVVLSSFLAILALGQGATILTGGLDLSLPWMIALVGIVVAGLVGGSDGAALWAVPLGLGLGTALGAVNGLGIVVLGLPPIVMTLAMNGILQGAALLYSGGTPAGFVSPAMRWVMTGHLGGLTPVVWGVLAFVVAATVLLGRTVFGRRIYAVGNSQLAARFSGIGVGRTLVGVYALSGFCSALVGVLLASFSGQASLGMGDEYLLPSIAAVVVGGSLITGGRGRYIGMLGGVLLLTALSTLLAGTMLPHAVQNIVFGLVVLGAVLALRD